MCFTHSSLKLECSIASWTSATPYSASQLETNPKISSHGSKNGIKLKDHSIKSNSESLAKKKSKRELFNEPSAESDFNDKIVKEEIEDFDSQTDFLGDETLDSLNIGIKIETSEYLYQDDHLIADDAKGQIISGSLLDVFIWTKKRTKIFLYFCPSLYNSSLSC